MHSKIRLVLVDDHPLHLDGLELLLKKEKNFEVIHTSKTGAEFLKYASNNLFDIVLLDLHLPDMDGISISGELQKMKHPSKIILLTMQRGGRYIQKAEKLSVKGYVLKSSDIETIKNAIYTVQNGGEVFDQAENKISHEEELRLKSSVVIDEHPDNLLSEREREILILVCKEYSSSQIAEKLFISTGTVDTHRKNILVKLSVNNTVGLVKYAIKHGLI
ncbi:MAG: response regulator transcription factor [Bacteroidota bacterium]|nr:response regulator transcription factor [Bacteroidota bacterium]